ncbi:Structure-specific endonuclease subunit SLX1, partial [Cyberlindnera fabianii]
MGHKKDTVKVHMVPQLYGVYLVQSIPKKNSFYIGSTNDPERRLQQHNGLKTGGAYRTKPLAKRPWQMILYVHGFPSKATALSFEFSFQHAYKSRHIPSSERIVTSKSGGHSLAHKLLFVRQLIKSPFFSKMGLKVQLFTNEAYKCWCDNKFGVLISDRIKGILISILGHVKQFKDKIIQCDKEVLSKYSKVFEFGELECILCPEKIDYINSDQFPLVAMLSMEFIEQTKDKEDEQMRLTQKKERTRKNISSGNDIGREEPVFIPDGGIIPSKGTCPKCGKMLMWPTLVRNATRARASQGFTLEEPLTQSGSQFLAKESQSGDYDVDGDDDEDISILPDLKE